MAMKRTLIYLILILFFGAIFRLWSLDKIPEGFHADEAAFGYNAYSLLKTGKDEYGKPLPLILRSFDDYKGAIYSYITVPFVAFFGLNEFSVRLPSAIFGMLFVLLAYLLTYELTGNRVLALVTSALAAISPTGIIQSRVQSNPLSADVMIIASIYELIRWIKSNHWMHLLLSSFLIFASPLMYLSAQLFYPFILPYVIFYFRNSMTRKMKATLLIVTVLFIAYSLSLYVMGGARYGQVSMFSNGKVLQPLTQSVMEEGVAGSTPFITRIFHNKALTYIRYLSREAGKYLSFDFLFYESQEPLRERIPEVGIFYMGEVVFLFFGFISFIRSRKKYTAFLMFWIVISIVGISFAIEESPNIHRFFIVLLPLHIITASGIIYVWLLYVDRLHKGVATFLFVVTVMIVYAGGAIFFFHQLFVIQPVHQPYFRAFAYKELVAKLQSIQKQYDTIILTKSNSSPYIHILFYTAYDPHEYQAIGSPRDLEYARFNNILFVPEECPFNEVKYDRYKAETGTKNLFIDRGGCPKTVNARVIDSIKWRDTMEAFQLIEYVATPTGNFKTAL